MSLSGRCYMEIKLCIDMRRTYEAVVRERYCIPTVDEILQDLSF